MRLHSWFEQEGVKSELVYPTHIIFGNISMRYAMIIPIHMCHDQSRVCVWHVSCYQGPSKHRLRAKQTLLQLQTFTLAS